MRKNYDKTNRPLRDHAAEDAGDWVGRGTAGGRAVVTNPTTTLREGGAVCHFAGKIFFPDQMDKHRWGGGV